MKIEKLKKYIKLKKFNKVEIKIFKNKDNTFTLESEILFGKNIIFHEDETAEIKLTVDKNYNKYIKFITHNLYC